jgi:hypothetical protein
MKHRTKQNRIERDSRIESAISAYLTKQYSSIRKAADAFNLPFTTVRDRMAGRNSRIIAHESQQTLSNGEESILIRWITRLTRTGFPASPKLVMEMAEEVRAKRVQLTRTRSSITRPIGYSWLQRFQNRYTELGGIWNRQIEGVRFHAVNYDIAKSWFDAVIELVTEHQYPPERIFNMDESGFAVGDSQSSRSLVNVREGSSWKVISGRQEWITAIECVNATGEAIPPLLIYKAKHTNTAWIPTHTPSNWRFSTSMSGWTSNSHAYEWITTVFEPITRPEDPSVRRLLIMDGHISHITANLIAFCMEQYIDLLILPPHTSHVLQPLDISIFAPLKRALAYETDQISRLDCGRISRVQWTEMYIRARTKAFSSNNILAGWKGAGLVPLEPMRVLEKLSTRIYTTPLSPRTPPQQDQFDLSLLESSPPDGTELRQANNLLNSTLRTAENLPEKARRYAERMTKAYETTHSELIIAQKRLAEQDELLQARKKRTKGKRIALKGKFVFSTEEVLEIARQAEADTAARSARKTIRKRTIGEINRTEEEEIAGNNSDNSDSDCIVVSSRT